MAEPLLVVDRLCKRYGSLVVSDGVELEVRRGEAHALIGPNGAGKTTLIHQLAGSVPSDSGRIVLDGEDITRLSVDARVRKGLARSFQITSILPGYTALENVALAVQARSGSSFRFLEPVADEALLNDEALAALERVGLGHRAAMRAGSLSHGEKRLLEIAIAIATRPKLLLLDEPLAGLGQEESKASIELLRRLKSELTLVLVEHDMDAVFTLADRVSVLVYGQVVATGTPAEIRANAQVRAAYLGADDGPDDQSRSKPLPAEETSTMLTMTPGITRAGEGIDNIAWNILGQTYVPKQVSESSFSWHATFPPGTFVPPHIHPTQDEFIYMLEGEFELMLDGKTMGSRPGDLIRMPMGIPHAIFNKSDRIVKCFFWVSPTRRLYDLFWAIHNMPEQTPPEVVALSAKHEVDFLPPPEDQK